MKTYKITTALGFILLALCLILPQLPVPEYWITLFNYTGMYALPVLGLVLLTGFARISSLAQAAFVGIGAYATAIVAVKLQISPWVGLLVGMGLATSIAFFIGLLTMRLSGHYLTLATLAWGLSLFYLFKSVEFLGKDDGISGIQAISIAGFELNTPRRIYYLIWIMLLLSILGVSNLLNSRIGRAIQSLKGGNVLSEAMGINSQWLKMLVFVLAAVLAAMSGFLYAGLQKAVNPTPFGINYGIEYLFMAVIGGMGQVSGALIGAALITILKDSLQSYLPSLLGEQANYEMVILGISMVLILQFTRDGIGGAVSKLLPQRIKTVVPPQLDKIPRLPPKRREVVKDQPLLEVKALRKCFGELVAVNDVGFNIGQGEVVGLIGPNGAGKSTVFNLITGVLPLTSGEVMFCGEKINHLGAAKIVAQGVGRTFQHVRLLPQLTVLENVAIGAHLRGHAGALKAALRLDRKEEQQLLAEAAKQIEQVGLSEHIYTPVGSLALGQQRVVEIARALAGDPTLLLLDEPAAGLRYQEKQALSKLLSQLRQEGVSVLLVEHDMDFVMNLTDHLVVMEYGTCIAKGTPKEIQKNPAVLRAYLGDE